MTTRTRTLRRAMMASMLGTMLMLAGAARANAQPGTLGHSYQPGLAGGHQPRLIGAKPGLNSRAPAAVVAEPAIGIELGIIGHVGHDHGLLIDQLVPGGLAARYGLEPGDAILSMNGIAIDCPHDYLTALSNSRGRLCLQVEDCHGRGVIPVHMVLPAQCRHHSSGSAISIDSGPNYGGRSGLGVHPQLRGPGYPLGYPSRVSRHNSGSARFGFSVRLR